MPSFSDPCQNIKKKVKELLEENGARVSVRRELFEYLLEMGPFKEQFLKDLKSLLPKDHLMDSGAGNLYAVEEYLGTRASFERQSFINLLRGNYDPIIEAISKSPFNDKANVTAISYVPNNKLNI